MDRLLLTLNQPLADPVELLRVVEVELDVVLWYDHVLGFVW